MTFRTGVISAREQGEGHGLPLRRQHDAPALGVPGHPRSPDNAVAVVDQPSAGRRGRHEAVRIGPWITDIVLGRPSAAEAETDDALARDEVVADRLDRAAGPLRIRA